MSRAKRTQQFRDIIEKEWTLKYWDFIHENSDQSWDWVAISRNPYITMDIIRENLGRPWVWKEISCNPNITIDFIRENPDKPWDWDGISLNEFQKEKQLFIENAYKEHIASYRIQNWWLKITMSPYYKIGRKFIDRDGLALFNEYNEIISYEQKWKNLKLS